MLNNFVSQTNRYIYNHSSKEKVMSPDEYYELANSFGFEEPDDGFDEERMGEDEPYEYDDVEHLGWADPYGNEW